MPVKHLKMLPILAVTGIAAVCGIFLLRGEPARPEGIPAKTADDRLVYLFTQGWKAEEIGQAEVIVPDGEDANFAAYAALQDTQGLPVRKFAGQAAMRYTYRLSPSEQFAELLCADGQVIGAMRYGGKHEALPVSS